ncbi:MAG: TerB family tellurite resistance protein [Reichenbachiella sp.]
MEYRTQLSILIQLSLIDNQLSNLEKRYIYALGKANKIQEVEIDNLFEELLATKKHDFPNPGLLSDDEKFEYLYNIVQLMKVDKRVYLSEIRFCQKMASKLGYKKSVVTELSGSIFSDPSITANRDHLKEAIQKYKVSN